MTISDKLLTINQQKLNIKAAIQRKLGVSDIGMNLSEYPSYIRQIKNVTPVDVSGFTGSSTIDKCEYINYLKGEIASAIQDCDVMGFDTKDLLQYAVAVNQIKTGTTPTAHTLSIEGPAESSGETCSFTAVYDGLMNITNMCTWTVINGGTYASVSNGDVTIDSSATAASVTLQATYDTLTATKEITVTYKSGTVTETQTTTVSDESGNTTTITTTVVTNDDGSSSSNSTTVNYDDEGNTTGSIENTTNINSDGSSDSTTTNYNENGDPTSQVNEAVDVLGNEDTQNIEYNESGNPVVVEYIIDTTNNQTTGTQPLTGGTGVDTDFIPFDGSNGFEMIIKFRTVNTEQPNPPIVEDTEDTSVNYLFNIMGGKSATSPYPGIDIRWACPKTNYGGGKLRARYQPASGSKTDADITSLYNNSTDKIYYIKYVYDPSLSSNRMKIINMWTNTNVATNNNILGAQNLEVTLGYTTGMSGQKYRYSNVEIYEFHIRKL